MTATTIGAKFAVVDVISTMAGKAAAVDALHFFKGTAVAVVAGDRYVGAVEREFCLCVMVEQPNIPSHRVVAIAT